eukprot:12427853-Karenia_brevis.AAC.1
MHCRHQNIPNIPLLVLSGIIDADDPDGEVITDPMEKVYLLQKKWSSIFAAKNISDSAADELL